MVQVVAEAVFLMVLPRLSAEWSERAKDERQGVDAVEAQSGGHLNRPQRGVVFISSPTRGPWPRSPTSRTDQDFFPAAT